MCSTGACGGQATRKTLSEETKGHSGSAAHDLQLLLGFDARTSDHQRDSDVKLVQLPLVDGQRELA